MINVIALLSRGIYICVASVRLAIGMLLF